MTIVGSEDQSGPALVVCLIWVGSRLKQCPEAEIVTKLGSSM